MASSNPRPVAPIYKLKHDSSNRLPYRSSSSLYRNWVPCSRSWQHLWHSPWCCCQRFCNERPRRLEGVVPQAFCNWSFSWRCPFRFRHQHAEKTSATNYNYRQAASGANCESGGTRQSHPAKDPKRTLNTNQHSDPIAGFLYHIWKSLATSLCNLCFCSNTLHICSHMFTYVSKVIVTVAVILWP